ncbi:DctP family TRAP transporter solute-binding subunit [Actinomycetospora rhizophila]|uniref:DctP family TRAP transporter solute-binding subunit n=1 Tax=Actinomycetospora rhizophila TaxID=1416876 RepID=A0ABV9ZHZ4_9PSEU
MGAVVVLVGAVLAGCGLRGAGQEGGSSSYTLRLSHVVSPSTPKGQAALRFEQVVEERSGGRIAVEVYPNSELFGDEDELQGLQSGAVQALAPASAKFTTIAPRLQVLDLPFLFRQVDDIPRVASRDTPVGRAIFANPELARRDIEVLELWDNGLKQLSSNNRIVRAEDMTGLRFRIQPSDVLRAQFAAWGAQSTPLSFSEVYTALQQGLIDGQENPWSNIESQKMHTVQRFITESDHGYVGYVLVVNRPFLESLPPDLQQVVRDGATESARFNREVAARINEEAEQEIVAARTTEIVQLSPAERAALEASVVPGVWQEMAPVIGQDVIDQLLAERRR